MKARLAHLDLLRGIAALLVCAEHLRAFLMKDYSRVAKPELWDRVFYFFTGLGHQAVMIFFVLSGYFVGGSVISLYEKKKWSWQRYLVRRLSRLWVVLIPALVLTLIWDKFGCHLNGAGYSGSYHQIYCSGPALQTPADWRVLTFFGNCFFLQTICVSPFGTNGPLWSLANEFWYYIMFPLLAGMISQPKFISKFLSGTFALILLICLPKHILIGGLVWLLGVMVYLACRNNLLVRICGNSLWLVLALGLAMASLVASKTSSIFGSDLSIGITFALVVVGLAVRNSGRGYYAGLAAGMGEASYTLYVTHFSFLAFIFFAFFNGNRFQPGLISYFWYFGILAVTLLYAAIVWWAFERNTDRIRKYLEIKFGLVNVKASPVDPGNREQPFLQDA